VRGGVDAVVERWLASSWIQPCFCVDSTIEGSPGAYTPLPSALAPGIAHALRERGIDRLYAHQTRAIEAACAGRHVVIATPTASGKSVAFHAPVLQALFDDPSARALYIYPTKALARDQEAGLLDLMTRAGLGGSAVVYDGDTPADARRAARERARVILTNPDMLHAAILPHHASWSRTLQNLRYIVIDELHTYRGVFGSHVANVLTRLARVAKFHGSHPRLIGATATLGNPLEHAARLFGVPESDVTVVTENGAPRGERRLFLFNPPVVNSELGIRASYLKQAVRLAADLVRANVPTIVFGQSRNAVEVMLRYLRDAVASDARRTDKGAGIHPSRIMAYRGGYLPAERRDIERRLRGGEILCVVATNALELGIDVGELDAVICAGYPGSIAATWQRFGRAGRRNARSVSVLVASSHPLDQYLAREPQFLQGAPIEQARIDPNNAEILIQHLKCAAFELPFTRGESFGSLNAAETAEAMSFLAAHNVVHEASGTFHWAADAYPANDVSLRSIGWDNVVIIDVEHDRCIAELDWHSAHTMLHDQAIYQHDSECWQVERFDRDNRKAFVRSVEPDYWTTAMTNTKVSILEDLATGPLLGAGWTSAWGEVSIVEKVVGFKKIKFFTHENAGYGEVRLPEMQVHTTAFWLTLPEWPRGGGPIDRAAAIDALRGMGAALKIVATLALMADPRDLGATLADPEPGAGGTDAGSPDAAALVGYRPTLFLYEHVPGGTGLAERIWAQREILLARTFQMILTCPCAEGCPACVGPGDASRKTMALQLLRAGLARQAVASDSPFTCFTSP
jgi:DEAD/DEAH box helicase domain-containing protein